MGVGAIKLWNINTFKQFVFFVFLKQIVSELQHQLINLNGSVYYLVAWS